MAEIWKSVFGFDYIGIHEEFSSLGGHSLLALQILTRVRAAYNVNITLRDFFEAPAIAPLSALIQDRLIAEIENLSDDEVRELLAEAFESITFDAHLRFSNLHDTLSWISQPNYPPRGNGCSPCA